MFLHSGRLGSENGQSGMEPHKAHTQSENTFIARSYTDLPSPPQGPTQTSPHPHTHPTQTSPNPHRGCSHDQSHDQSHGPQEVTHSGGYSLGGSDLPQPEISRVLLHGLTKVHHRQGNSPQRLTAMYSTWGTIKTGWQIQLRASELTDDPCVCVCVCVWLSGYHSCSLSLSFCPHDLLLAFLLCPLNNKLSSLCLLLC